MRSPRHVPRAPAIWDTPRRHLSPDPGDREATWTMSEPIGGSHEVLASPSEGADAHKCKGRVAMILPYFPSHSFIWGRCIKKLWHFYMKQMMIYDHLALHIV